MENSIGSVVLEILGYRPNLIFPTMVSMTTFGIQHGRYTSIKNYTPLQDIGTDKVSYRAVQLITTMHIEFFNISVLVTMNVLILVSWISNKVVAKHCTQILLCMFSN